MNKETAKMRLTFEKGAAARYLGHLDLLRTFVRALRRAQIPVKYTQGFNPHAVLTFALPSGVGVTSECEIVDVSVDSRLPVQEVIDKINANMPADAIRVISGEYTDRPMPVIEKAEYILDITSGGAVNENDINIALSQGEVLVEKKSKKKTNMINIMEHIYESEIIDASQHHVQLRVIISAGNTFNIKPQLVVEALSNAVQGFEPINALFHRRRFIFKQQLN